MTANSIKNVLVWTLIPRKREMLRSMSGWALGTFCSALISMGVLFDLDAPVSEYRLYGCVPFLLVAYVFVMFRFATGICYNMKTKNDFISYAMLPATKGEKFVANWIYCTLLMCAVAVAGIIVGDLAQMLYTYVTRESYVSITKAIFKTLSAGPFSSVDDLVVGIPLLAFIHSLFVLGGCFFRRHAAIYTFLIILLVPSIVSAAVGMSIGYVIEMLREQGYTITIDWYVDNSYETLMECIGALTFTLLTALVYWLSFRLFRRMQVINNRFFN